jgi:hypothetical protein
MKVNLYIKKQDFDKFFTWLNRLAIGVITEPPVQYLTSQNDIEDLLQVSLLPDEYCLIRDTEKYLEDIRKTYGSLELTYKPEPLQEDRIVMANIIQKAGHYDLALEVVETAIQLATQIPGITPLEALIISEKDWLNVEKT